MCCTQWHNCPVSCIKTQFTQGKDCVCGSFTGDKECGCLSVHAQGIIALAEVRQPLKEALAACEARQQALAEAKAAEQARLIRRLENHMRKAAAETDGRAAELAQLLAEVDKEVDAFAGCLARHAPTYAMFSAPWCCAASIGCLH